MTLLISLLVMRAMGNEDCYTRPLVNRIIEDESASEIECLLSRFGQTREVIVMVQTDSALRCLPCQDSEESALTMKRMLNVPRDYARKLGQSALKAVADGTYIAPSGRRIDWRERIERAKTIKQSIGPDDALPSILRETFAQTTVQVRNETTMQAAKSFVERGLHPLALNFANSISAGGGFLNGARAQEKVLCRSSALYATLEAILCTIFTVSVMSLTLVIG